MAKQMEDLCNKFELINLNIGGVNYTTLKETLNKHPTSILHNLKDKGKLIREIKENHYFIDRNGHLFQHILEYLRMGKLLLPVNFTEIQALYEEAKFYKLDQLTQLIESQDTKNELSVLNNGAVADPPCSYITISYRGSFAFGRNGQADVKFRKVTRILVCGKLTACRMVFGETLNESRDPDSGGEDRYSSRLYLKHNSLEAAFNQLAQNGMKMIACTSSGASSAGTNMGTSSSMPEMGGRNTDDEQRWSHYSVFIFCKQ